jgi:sterol desaturase/sphingolipid hydroxylase (fatty acid hydroxylase superfamily)
MHKVPFLWRFHRIHHAGTEFNIMVGTRVSLGESAFNRIVEFLFIVIVCGIPSPGYVFLIITARQFIDLFQHSDVPWDYGRLGYLIASPRFHRVHHSNQPEDHDSNYGDILSFWDIVFGTTNRHYFQDTRHADRVQLGLHANQEAEINSNWRRVVVQDSWLPTLWLVTRKIQLLGTALFQRWSKRA